MNCCLQILDLVLYQDSEFRHLFSLKNHEQLGDGGLVFHYESRVLNKQIGTMLNG
ncbi:hypothetical protein WICANDRAFT_91033 [Wickerhamomyces anomalus NRRL Y-366-8]|uniref:Uncharacterized protein n=1 Tax=Wickerhamomyces anomalus (strain ATCC 58044 / CBS 1984 / NCYC 433 / NRRL Y-366-8) TaxID=683960 RepID=A0A1E3P7U4_WICAA|nr:uncharacterized protein WICANDRAFT_91033 [Wickerhamomyces anomalus NRRL Y-366-8]ODQ61491.1 hypothetical protein WICANDRAFT_91033 [Wickerhamomyces anomalus NRRL Y-366-8]